MSVCLSVCVFAIFGSKHTLIGTVWKWFAQLSTPSPHGGLWQTWSKILLLFLSAYAFLVWQSTNTDFIHCSITRIANLEFSISRPNICSAFLQDTHPGSWQLIPHSHHCNRRLHHIGLFSLANTHTRVQTKTNCKGKDTKMLLPVLEFFKKC